MRVIDMHTHIFPDKVAEKATVATAQYFDLPEPPNHHGKVQELADVLAEAGVEYAMVFSAATTAHQVESIHRFICEQCQKYPQFIPCGTLHAEYENYREELKWLRDHGIHGVKIHPEFQHFALDDERLFPMFEEMERTDMFLICHMGDPRVDVSGPKHLLPVATTFPKLRCIAAHLGNWGDWDMEKIRPLTRLDNVYTDISSSFSYVEDKRPLYDILYAYDPPTSSTAPTTPSGARRRSWPRPWPWGWSRGCWRISSSTTSHGSTTIRSCNGRSRPAWNVDQARRLL